VVFLGGVFGFFWVGFLLPTLHPGGPSHHPGVPGHHPGGQGHHPGGPSHHLTGPAYHAPPPYSDRFIAQQIASNNARREALRLDAMLAASRQGDF
jgi:hypothetical protein